MIFSCSAVGGLWSAETFDDTAHPTANLVLAGFDLVPQTAAVDLGIFGYQSGCPRAPHRPFSSS